MRITRPAAVLAAILTLTLAVAACSSSGSSASAAKTQAKHGGTVTVGWVAATPNFIFPLAPATNTDGYNVNLTQPLWPYLVYQGDGSQAIVNPQESLYSSLVYSNGDKTITIDLKHWNWSDGQPITSRDFTFTYNLLKANYQNWIDYLQGLFPVDVASVSTPTAHTVIINLTRAYNPTFYTDDVLTTIPLLPQHAWDKESVSGAVGNYDETTAGAKAVYNFLQKQGSQIATFATNPLWKVVDGPWTLSYFNSNGTYDYVPNKHYSGSAKPYLSKWVNLQFTTGAAELDELRSGGTLDVASLPLNDVQQEGVLKAEGYSFVPLVPPGVANIQPNLYNVQVGAMLRQLYIRQAMEDLINRPQIVSKVYDGYADPGNGPVPVDVYGSLVSPLEKSGGPYPYSPSTAISLLKAHGWKVNAGGISTCQSPGTAAADCGAGITAGEQLSFNLAYSSGDAATDQQEAAIQSTEEQAGIKFNLKSEPFNTLVGEVGSCSATSHPASTCGWQLTDIGYDPYQLYPSGSSMFNTGGFNNEGGYSNTQENNLINETEYSPSSSVFLNYENYTAQQLPYIWLPNPDFLQAYKSNLHGFAPLNSFSGGNNEEDWYFSS
jgi:peptide/nickel transport system substrate-binding protein